MRHLTLTVLLVAMAMPAASAATAEAPAEPRPAVDGPDVAAAGEDPPSPAARFQNGADAASPLIAATEQSRRPISFRLVVSPDFDLWLVPDGALGASARDGVVLVHVAFGAHGESFSAGRVDAAANEDASAAPSAASAATSEATCPAVGGASCSPRPVKAARRMLPSVDVAYVAPSMGAWSLVPPEGATEPFAFGASIEPDAGSGSASAAARPIGSYELLTPSGSASPASADDGPTAAAGPRLHDASAATGSANAGGAPIVELALRAAAAAAVAGTLFAPLAIYLYTRLSDRSKFLEDESRARIFATIRATPGLTATDIERNTGLHRTTAAYHARRLQQAGYITVVREGGVNRYFETNAAPDPEMRMAMCLMRYKALRRLLEGVIASPGATTRDLAAALSVSRRAVAYHLQRLLEAGLIQRSAVPGGGHAIRPTPLGQRVIGARPGTDGSAENPAGADA